MNVSRTALTTFSSDKPSAIFLPMYVVQGQFGQIGFTYIDITSPAPILDNPYYAVIDSLGIGCNHGKKTSIFKNVPKTHPWYAYIATERY